MIEKIITPAFIIFVMALLRRKMSGRALLNSLVDTAKLWQRGPALLP